MKHSMQMAEVKPSPADSVNESRATLEESLDQVEAIGKIGLTEGAVLPSS